MRGSVGKKEESIDKWEESIEEIGMSVGKKGGVNRRNGRGQ